MLDECMIRINVLGPVEVIDADRLIPVQGKLVRTLLAVLALHIGEIVPVHSLVEFLWGDAPPATARNKVQSNISMLRKILQSCDQGNSVIVTRWPGYFLSRDGVSTDLAQFKEMYREAVGLQEAGDLRRSREMLSHVLDLWRGSAFADVNSSMLRAAADGLEELRMLAIEAKAQAELELGLYSEVAAELATQVAMHPLRDMLRAEYMFALFRLNCRNQALAVYREGYGAAVGRLGLPPSPQLSRLHELMVRDHKDLWTVQFSGLFIAQGAAGA